MGVIASNTCALGCFDGPSATDTNDGLSIRFGQAARSELTGALHDAGAPILLGTDTGNPWVAAGFSVHQELANLVAAGLTPYEALRAATRSDSAFVLSAAIRANASAAR